VAFFVFGMFFIHLGLINSGVLQAGSWAHLLVMLPFIAVQLKTLEVMWRIKRNILDVPGDLKAVRTTGS
jgi:uncharacterized protein (DUF983 family)